MSEGIDRWGIAGIAWQHTCGVNSIQESVNPYSICFLLILDVTQPTVCADRVTRGVGAARKLEVQA
jgi:hypothetical protein